MRLLVIEDNRQLVANLFDYFESRGHVLDVAPDGITGLHLAGSHPYDAVILDWMLPRMDGLEVLRQLRDDEQLKRIPVVVLTSSREESDLARSWDLGVNAYVVKPVDSEQFFTAVKTLGRFWAVLNETPTTL